MAGGAGLGDPVRVPITWTCCPSAQHTGGLLPSLGHVSPPFLHPWLGNEITAEVLGSPGDGPHHGVTLFPSALVQLELGTGIVWPPPAAQGVQAGGASATVFWGQEQSSSPSIGPFSLEHLPGKLMDLHCQHPCVVPVRLQGGPVPTPGSPIPTSPSWEGARLLSNCLASPPASSSI